MVESKNVVYDKEEMSSQPMLALTDILRFRPNYVNLGSLPIMISRISLITTMIFALVGLAGGLFVYSTIDHWVGWIGLGVGGAGALGYGVSFIRPWSGESVQTWIWWTMRQHRTSQHIAGRDWQLYLGCAPYWGITKVQATLLPELYPNHSDMQAQRPVTSLSAASYVAAPHTDVVDMTDTTSITDAPSIVDIADTVQPVGPVSPLKTRMGSSELDGMESDTVQPVGPASPLKTRVGSSELDGVESDTVQPVGPASPLKTRIDNDHKHATGLFTVFSSSRSNNVMFGDANPNGTHANDAILSK